MTDFKQVSEAEFKEFIDNYPNKLEFNVSRMCEPPMGSHNDFSDGKIWPESMVTQVILTNGEAYYDNEPNTYFIKEVV
nr:MAG TPA: hypothetical protein [Caudoviricetes sp.]